MAHFFKKNKTIYCCHLPFQNGKDNANNISRIEDNPFCSNPYEVGPGPLELPTSQPARTSGRHHG